MVQPWDVTDVEIDGRTFWVRPVGSWVAETAGTAPANLSASCDTDTFVLLMYGQFSLESAVATGRMTAEGNQSPMTGFDQWLAGH